MVLGDGEIDEVQEGFKREEFDGLEAFRHPRLCETRFPRQSQEGWFRRKRVLYVIELQSAIQAVS